MAGIDFADLPLRRNIHGRYGDALIDGFSFDLQTSTGVADMSFDGTWDMQVYDNPDGAQLLQASTTTAYTTTGIKDLGSGAFEVVIAAADHATIGAGDTWCEVTHTFASDHASLPSVAKTILEGTLHLRKASR